LAALVLFVGIGGRILPGALRGVVAGGAQASPTLSAALLLNVALVLFAWRRCRDLRRQSDARIAAEVHATEASTTDVTTGLLNRAAFTAAANESVASRGNLALLVLDLDHFKKVNDHYGHSAGDEALARVGFLLRDCAGPGAVCGRLGGDEFAVLVQVGSYGSAAVDELADVIIARISEPIAITAGVAQLGVSIGIATSSGADETFASFLRRADIAMYEAKKAGRNQFAWFDARMEAHVQRQAQLEADMRQGIAAGEFVPFYQPQANIQSGRIHGFEVLARWNHPREGLLEPAHFIALAEGTGLIGPLSLSVMKQALLQAREWSSDLMIAVNVSPVQLKDRLFSQRVMKILTETGFPAARLELEITESAIFEDSELALETIESLKAIGVTISLDDFGTGYSSLAQLKNLPFDRIKIDRSFVLSMLENDESAAIVSAITSLGASLKLPITAEGIETDVVRRHLSQLGCSEGQGWFYGRPLTTEQVARDFPELVQELPIPVPMDTREKPISFIAERRDTRRRGRPRAA
jgi:diguanylate cyclase (GGDEF)-like protein